jgi:hypothetical protein
MVHTAETKEQLDNDTEALHLWSLYQP